MVLTLYVFLLSALTYKYIVLQQPIGRQLFRLFCDKKPDLKKAINFLDEIVSTNCGLVRYVKLADR